MLALLVLSVMGFAKSQVIMSQPESLKRTEVRWVYEQLSDRLRATCDDCTYHIRELRVPSFPVGVTTKNLALELDTFQPHGAFNIPMYYEKTYSAGSGQTRSTREVIWTTGFIKVHKPVVVLNRSIPMLERVQSSDIETKVSDITFAQERPVTAADIVGSILARPMQAGQIVYLNDLKREPVAKRGQLLKVLIAGENFEVSSQGTAEENGFVGDLIKVKSVDNQKILLGKVVEPGVVKVQ